MSTSKQSESFPGRTFYQGGGVNWGRFLPWLLAAFAVAAALAAGMFQLFDLGQYYVVIVPAIAGLAVAGMMILAVNKGHCRSVFVAGASGAAAGLVLYLGYYYCGMVSHLGPDFARRPDVLPAYIRLRMNTDVIRDAHDSRRDESKEKRGNPWFNWFTFGLEAFVVLGLTTVPGVQRSRKPFCAACQRWMMREVTYFNPAQSAELLEALRNGSARSLAALSAQSPFTTVPNLTLAAEFCPSVQEGRSRDCPVYASLKNVEQGSGSPMRDPFDAAKGKVLLRSMQLHPDEIAALGSRFGAFEALAGRAAVAALKPEEPAPGPAGAEADSFAEIKAVEPDYAGRILTRRTALIGSGLIVLGLVPLFAGLALAAWGGITAFPDKDSPQEVAPGMKAAGIAALTLGLIGFGGTVIFYLVNPSCFGNRYLRKRTRLEFSRRPKCLVDPNDPEALFVEIVPKLNWGKMKLENASDVGFLVVDPRRRELRFEGDKQRYRIPAGTITDCAVEVHVEGQGTAAATRVYFVVLRARHPDGFWEAPLRERSGEGMLLAGRRKKAAFRLCEAIQQVRGPGADNSPPVAR